jgi:colanic acid biosynthesis protein WcaH
MAGPPSNVSQKVLDIEVSRNFPSAVAPNLRGNINNPFSAICGRPESAGNINMNHKESNEPKREPKPGEWLAPKEFAEVIRLTPLVAIDLIVRRPDRRVLVGRRINEPAKGLFFVPGSRISKNERLADAFTRVTTEELGVEVPLSKSKLLGVYEHLYPTNRFDLPGFGTHYIVLAHELRLALDPAKLPQDQHGEYFWFTPAEILASTDVHENTKAYFKPE